MITIKSIMTKDVVTVSPSTSIADAAKLVISKGISSLVVVEKDKPIGMVSEIDIINGVMSNKSKAKDIMDKNFLVINGSVKFSHVSKILREKNIKKFPVVENSKLVGLITETDIVEATRDFTRFHQIMQDIILAVFGIATAFFLFYFSPLRSALFG